MSNKAVLLRESIRKQLRTQGLCVPQKDVPYLRALIHQRGEVEFGWLREEVGPKIWDGEISLVASKDPTKSILWVLGHGSFLTEFAVAPLELSHEDAYKVIQLGARANLIVSLYDNFLDQGYCPSDILNADFSTGSRIQLVSSLVQGYFRNVQLIPLLRKAIRTMYEAENQSQNGVFNHHIWRRKCALPLVVMGLGSWGTRLPEKPLAYLSWLYRVGCVVGWIDDAADVEKDAQRGRSNRFQNAETPETMVKLIQRVMEWWDRHAFAPESRNAFLYCLQSWIAPRTS